VTAFVAHASSLLRRRAGHDFSQYKENTIARRLERRMKALQIETVEQYIQTLERQPEETDRLFNDLLIGVTQFFRNGEAFAALQAEVIPKLFEGKGGGDQVRVCVMGCATGEEAYSIAILLSEHASTRGTKGPDFLHPDHHPAPKVNRGQIQTDPLPIYCQPLGA
jgi:two-component system CheB/CheR fusion protein